MISKIEAFLEIAKTKNLTKAADNLYTSQPSISMKLKALEELLETKLFDRTRKMELTEEGKMFLHYADSIYHLFIEATTAINDFKNLDRGTLSISTGSYYGTYVLPHMLGEFKSKFPKVNIQIKVTNTEDVFEDLVANHHEIGFVSEYHLIGRFPQLICEPLFTDDLVFVCSKIHPLGNLDAIDLRLFTEETFIISDETSALRKLIEDNFQKHGIKFETLIILNGVEPMKRSVENNLGISILPRLSVEREIKSGQLKTVPIYNFSLSRKIYYLHRNEKTLSRASQEFLKMMMKHHLNSNITNGTYHLSIDGH